MQMLNNFCLEGSLAQLAHEVRVGDGSHFKIKFLI